jgi:hypothetical protein
MGAQSGTARDDGKPRVERLRANTEPAIAAGSILVLASLLLFAVNLWRNGGLNRSRDDGDEFHSRAQSPAP